MENLLISACLLGVECKYSGGSNALPEETIEKLRTRYRLIPVCPETAGGLPTPRDPSRYAWDMVIASGSVIICRTQAEERPMAVATACTAESSTPPEPMLSRDWTIW